MTRVGLGYDSHPFRTGRPLVLGGVRIAHDRGLGGHSDADAALHAVVDALCGAAALGDIGELFADTDPRWQDADSAALVAETVRRAAAEGLRPARCDLTILAEAPRLADHKPAMRRRIAELLGVAPEAVNVKAKTNERMGWIGRGEGIAALAVVTMAPRAAGA
jgi:2-C-methyl-D-erythritol 2,4-cyclodiphosphate synthase